MPASLHSSQASCVATRHCSCWQEHRLGPPLAQHATMRLAYYVRLSLLHSYIPTKAVVESPCAMTDSGVLLLCRRWPSPSRVGCQR